MVRILSCLNQLYSPLEGLDFSLEDIPLTLKSWNEENFDFVITHKISILYRNYALLRWDMMMERKLQLTGSRM
jgi:hypothetical protein